ncbi:MAG: chorismate mutase [Bacteroidota bacterium]
MADIRTEIDTIDHQIVTLIAERAVYIHRAAIFKKDRTALRDEKRVATVIASKKELAEKLGASPVLIGEVYMSMIDFLSMRKWKFGRRCKNRSEIQVEMHGCG